MFNTLFGLKVLREIPNDVLMGLLSGQYALHGGVIRWAAGTTQAGQIVRHLIPVAAPLDLVLPLTPLSPLPWPASILQLSRLTSLTQQVLQIATGTMVLSGLNLALSAVSFAALNRRFDMVEERLAAIQKDVEAIRSLLELKERATLRNALDNLHKYALIPDAGGRRQLLHDSHQTLGVVAHQYRELLVTAQSLEAALVADEYFCLAFLARARCSAEQGNLALAQHELTEDVALWTAQARRIARDLVIGEHRERFLHSETAQVAPVAQLVEWLDFVYEEAHGYGWVDLLRQEMEPWHRDWGIGAGLNIWHRSQEDQRVREREMVVPALARLSARSRALEGHVAQAALLARLNVTPQQFAERTQQLASVAVEGYLIV